MRQVISSFLYSFLSVCAALLLCYVKLLVDNSWQSVILIAVECGQSVVGRRSLQLQHILCEIRVRFHITYLLRHFKMSEMCVPYMSYVFLCGRLKVISTELWLTVAGCLNG